MEIYINPPERRKIAGWRPKDLDYAAHLDKGIGSVSLALLKET
jgi:hypothetical protein